MTAVIGIIAFGLSLYVGVIDRPGEPPSEISLGIGWFISLLGTILIAVGGALPRLDDRTTTQATRSAVMPPRDTSRTATSRSSSCA